MYVKGNEEEKKFQRQMFENTKKEIVKSEKFIADKKWEEVRSLYERRMYNMRNSMNYLAAASSNPKVSAKAAKKFYASMEDTGLKSKRKQQAAAKVAYTKMMDDLAKTMDELGIVVKKTFLQMFNPRPTWHEIWAGRAAILRLDGPNGSLDIVVFSFVGCPQLVKLCFFETFLWRHDTDFLLTGWIPQCFSLNLSLFLEHLWGNENS